MNHQPLADFAKSKKWTPPQPWKIAVCAAFLLFGTSATVVIAQLGAHDPGVRGGTKDAGARLASVAANANQSEYFDDGMSRFTEIDDVSGAAHKGLGRDSTAIRARVATRSRM